MFATLVGTNTEKSEYKTIFAKLYAIAIDTGFGPPNMQMRVQPDGSLDG